jgi:hypothetical protein
MLTPVVNISVADVDVAQSLELDSKRLGLVKQKKSNSYQS